MCLVGGFVGTGRDLSLLPSDIPSSVGEPSVCFTRPVCLIIEE